LRLLLCFTMGGGINVQKLGDADSSRTIRLVLCYQSRGLMSSSRQALPARSHAAGLSTVDTEAQMGPPMLNVAAT